MIDATLDANDRVRERRFAKGLPCLLTGLTNEQWMQGKAHPEEGLEVGCGTHLIKVSNLPRETILTAADWIERIAQRHSELSKLFLDGLEAQEFRDLAAKLREAVK